MIGERGDGVVEIPWVAAPFRADRFEAAWLPVAEAVLDFGARAWAFVRSREDPHQFTQYATFPDKLSFERYWYSEEVAEARAAASGLYQVPVLPVWTDIIGSGTVARETLER